VRRLALLLLVASCGCVTLTPGGKLVSVASASLDTPLALRQLPDGCHRVTVAIPDERMSEQEIEGQADPFRRQRNATAAGGGNLLFVLKRMSSGRGIDCPNGSRITDCAPYSGGWYAIQFESYTCTPEALKAIAAPKKTP
jgi:hypothetical protein